MVAELKMPALSPTMEEGKIVSWQKKAGDKIEQGDVLLEVETDKAVMEVENQIKGTFGKILCEADSMVKVGETIALILEKGEDASALDGYKVSVNTEKKEEKVEEKVENKVESAKVEVAPSAVEAVNNSNSNLEKVFASPLAKKIASQNSVDISSISVGSGPNGRIVKSDVEKFLAQGGSAVSSCFGRNPVEFVDVPCSGMRNTIAKRLTEAKQSIPHFYLKIQANMDNFVKFREQINALSKIVDGKPEFKVSANDIITMAIARALARFKDVNAIWMDGKIRKFNNVDLSVAVSVDGGLLTPVVKNADQMGLLELSRTIKDLAKRARDGKLSPAEYNGGSLTISNLGMFGVSEFTSIINPPQSCIIAVGKIENSAVALENGNVGVAKTCILTFSADHRVIDGALMGMFAQEVKNMLENPALMLI